jgi:CBS domain-containing protein
MRAKDVMTPNVITVGPDMTVQVLAALLSERGISGTPVVDSDGRTIGIVSEGDLLHRAELGTERQGKRRSSWWLEDFAVGRARDYVKSHSRTVGDIMTSEVVTVSEETELAEVATLLETKRIKRVPVTRDNKIVGIVSRANLVRALGATSVAPTPEGGNVDVDRSVRAQLLAELADKQWTGGIWAQDIVVNGGIVHLWFGAEVPEERRHAMRVAAENIAGVRGVTEHIVPVPLVF